MDSHKTVKIGLNSIKQHHVAFSHCLQSKINHVNYIVRHTYQFIKLYFLDLHSENKELPTLDQKFLLTAFRLFYTCKNGKGLSEQNKITYN